MVAVAYAPAVLWGGFVWDDTIFTEAEPVRIVSGLWDIWFAPEKIGREPHYWPLTYTTFWLEHKLWGFWAPGFHAINVVLHIANTLLLWRLLRRVEVPGAWLVAAVFAVHPLNVNSVAWIIERKDVLSGLFYLTAALAWLRYEEKAREDAGGWRHLVLSAMLLGAGLLCKSSVVTLPAALLIVQWWRHGRVSAGDLLRVAPLFAVAALVTALDLSLYLNRVLHSFDYSLVERVLVAGRALWFYPVKILWPADLAVVYPLWDVRVSDPGAWAYPAAAVALAAALWCLRRRIGRGPLAGALFYAVTVSPMLGIVPFSYMALSFVADRFQYLAGIGVTAVVIGAAAGGLAGAVGSAGWLPASAAVPVLARGLAVAVLLALGTLTWGQASLYRDDLTFFAHFVERNPTESTAQARVAEGLYKEGRHEEALAPLRKALELEPESAEWHRGVGVLLNKLKRHEEALGLLRKAVELDPRWVHAHAELGAVLDDMGRPEEALAPLRKALELEPESAERHVRVGVVLDKLKRHEEALDLLRRAVELDPRRVNAHVELGTVLDDMGRSEEALAPLRKALELEPESSERHVRVGVVLNKLKRHEEALDLLRRAVELDPRRVRAHVELGTVLDDMGRPEEALVPLRKALELEPESSERHVRVGVVLNKLKRHEEALDLLRRAVELDPRRVNAHVELGTVLNDMGRPEEALAPLRKALELDSRALEPLANLGGVLIALKRYDEAERTLDRAREHYPENAAILQNLGEVLRLQGRYEAAVEVYRAVIERDPSLPEAPAAMAHALLNLGRGEEAVGALEGALARSPDSPLVPVLHVLLGRISEEVGRLDEAAEHYAHALRVAPAHGEALRGLERLRLSEGRPEAAAQRRP